MQQPERVPGDQGRRGVPVSARRGKPVPESEPGDRGAPATPSSFERHPRWPEVKTFLGIEPGDNSFLVKTCRALARIENESREVGSGPDLVGEARRLSFAASEAGAMVERYTRARLGIPAAVMEQRDKAEDLLAAAEATLAERHDRMTEIAVRFKAAHSDAVRSLHDALRARMYGLADEATRIVQAASPGTQRHTERLPDRLDEIGRMVQLGVDLALAFSASTAPVANAADFYGSLPEGVAELVEARLRAGRSRRCVLPRTRTS